jgi:hypothetical protein
MAGMNIMQSLPEPDVRATRGQQGTTLILVIVILAVLPSSQ